MKFWEFALLLFVFVPMAVLWFRTIVDIFDRRDLSGPKKGLWLLAVAAVPLVGVLAYVFTRPVTEQDRERLDAYQQQTRSAGAFSVAGEIEKLDELRTKGVITQDEFDRQRTSLLR